MQLQNIKIKTKTLGAWLDYLNLIKPRETALLVFIGLVSAFIAGNGDVSVGQAAIIFLAILTASAGANGLTNYLDRHLDARMERTRRRALPSGRIFPAENALYFCLALAVTGLALSWFLHPLVFLADLVGTTSAVVYRKRVTCVFPQGVIASCAPVLMGWLAVRTTVNWQTLWLCVLISFWLPSHIWSIMLAHREDYLQAGIIYFPISRSFRSVTKILLLFSVVLVAASLGLYAASDYGWFFLGVALASGLTMIFASWRLMRSQSSQDAWRLYKYSSFPYLGLLFFTMALNIWLKFG
jgi:protoheme IX farnesyltransferase